MKEMWDKRYGAKAYAYGTEPNLFFKETLDANSLEGRILLPAEGEGRNAIYAAKKGLDVFAFDISQEGKSKALRLAEREQVTIHYEVGDFFRLSLNNQQYEAVGLIFAHFPPPIRAQYHQRIVELLKPGGLVVLEGFSTANLQLRQANPKVGGPNRLDMLFSKELIVQEFPNVDIIKLEEKETVLQEGRGHVGVSRVIQFVGRKLA